MTYAMRSGRAVIRKASFDEITHFVSGEKYVVAHTKDSEMILDETLVQIARNHPELIYTHRSTLVRGDDVVQVFDNRNRSGSACDSNYKASTTFGVELKVSRYQARLIRKMLAAREC